MDKSTLLHQFTKLESSRNELLDSLSSTEKVILNYKPAADKWSITQILYHLHYAELRSLSYVKKKMLAAQLENSGLLSALRFRLLKWMMLSGYKLKAPPLLGEVPDGLNYEEVILAWAETRVQLRTLIDQLSDDLLRKNIYRHPRAGRLNVFQMMGFFQDHFDHHMKQVKRLKRNVI
jgi:hypothetical protein